ncbi:MAG: 23S rRNA (uracil(1939)-C(5))-methyltransferase RlmD [Spirochaetes bacterium]|nr:23S rRNA (uracil(1939)-C(5))-methyltransferase RlmD [Spirochaetota bacterium]
MNIGDIYEVKITDAAYGDYSIGKLNNFVIFVDNYAIPEDIVKVKITSIKNNYAISEFFEIIKSSPYRINKKLCPSYEKGCGGCQWLGAQYKMQLAWKKKIINDSFRKIGKIEMYVHEVIGMDEPFYYRNKMTVHCDKGKAGFYKKRSYEVVEIEKCCQQMEFNQNIFDKIDKNYYKLINNFQIRSSSTGESILKINTSEFDKIKKSLKYLKNINFNNLIINNEVIFGNYYIEQKIKNLVFKIPHDGFFQVNYNITEKLIDEIMKFVSVQKNNTILDLYCGVGLFSLIIAQFCSKVLAVDNNEKAIDSAYQNALLNKIDNVFFKCSDAVLAFKKFRNEKIDIVILDPPRKGCDKEVLHEIINHKIKKIIYISCAPDTLARDLMLLIGNGYKIINCQPFDMFPHTYHVETAVFLEL